MNTSPFHARNLVIFGAIIAVVALITLAITFAAVGTNSFEAEQASISGSAAVQADPDASDGSFVSFAEQVSTEPVPYDIELVTGNFVVPWSIVFPSADRWLVSERKGTIQLVENGQRAATPYYTFTDVSTVAEEGLMGMVLDPDYASNKTVYACYARGSGAGITDRVVKFTDAGTTATNVETIIDNIPAARFHAGCRLGFGPDGKLYITTGDAFNAFLAQEQSSLAGKILRINKDGSIPADNPFSGSPIWTLGHRNPQGIAWHPPTGTLFATEHGEIGGDEVNIITPGSNYGWPNYSHSNTGEPDFSGPLLEYTPSVAPAGAMFYSGTALPQFRNNFFFANLAGQGIRRVIVDNNDPSQVLSDERMPDVNVNRIRDVAEGPDGAIYFMTSNLDGRAAALPNHDAIYRIAPSN
jgi:glucose/arabinose dehydrogenase